MVDINIVKAQGGGMYTWAATYGYLHEGEKFLTTRRHPSSFLDGARVPLTTGSATGLGD